MSEAKDYVGVLPCGCVVAWCSAGSNPRNIVQHTSRWIRQGLSVERLTLTEAKERFVPCVHREKQRSLPGTGLVIEDDGEGEVV